MVGKLEWTAIKNQWDNRCAICGQPESKARGQFEQAHLKANSRGGKSVVPAHHPCHRRYDNGTCTISELKRLGLSPEMYEKMRPKLGRKKTQKTLIQKAMDEQGKAAEDMIRKQNEAVRRYTDRL